LEEKILNSAFPIPKTKLHFIDPKIQAPEGRHIYSPGFQPREIKLESKKSPGGAKHPRPGLQVLPSSKIRKTPTEGKFQTPHTNSLKNLSKMSFLRGFIVFVRKWNFI